MNVIWITADTFRRDQLGAYGNDVIHTPVLDALAAKRNPIRQPLRLRLPHDADACRPSHRSVDHVLHGMGRAAR